MRQHESMVQPAEQALILRARSLLAQRESHSQQPNPDAEWINTALACHSRMLELGESDRTTAAELAIAGADLLQRVQPLEGSGGKIPEWVTIHEEQCCRYGAIWIHSLVSEGHPISADHVQRGLGLLERLGQLHPEPVPWIVTMRALLAQAASVPPTDASLRLVIVGNCQAHPLMIGLQQALPQLQIHACPSVHLASPEDVSRLHNSLPTTDLLVMHRVQPGYRNNIGLDSGSLRALLPEQGRCVVLPNLHFEGHLPWIGYAHDPDARLADLEAESPLGPYHDFLAMLAARDDLPLEALLEPLCPQPLRERLCHLHQQSLAELKTREADCDLHLSDWIANHHQQHPVAHTINHPTQIALDQLLRRLLQHLNLPHQLGDALFDRTEYLGALSIPIHPWVRQALDLDSWAERWGQRQGTPLRSPQQLQESIAFYRRHPWIAAANAHHPKLQLAEAVLNDARHITTSPPPPPPQAPTVFDCLWVSSSPLKALQELGHWVLAQPPGDHGQLQQLVEAASRTRDPELLSPALARLASHPPPDPWRSHFALQLQQAAGAPVHELCRLAREAFTQHHTSGQPWDEPSWRTLAALLQNEPDPELQATLQALVAAEAPLEQACHLAGQHNARRILAARSGIEPDDANRAAELYAHCAPSLRRPFAHWADPEAGQAAAVDNLIEQIHAARAAGRGFSLVRLGDGEGLFLSGRRPDLGGAIANGNQIAPHLAAQGNSLAEPEHNQLRQHLTEAVANADWIGIPDLAQCLSGPIDCVTVASGLALMLHPDQRSRAQARLMVGGWHIHNYLLQAGCFSRNPFDQVRVVIGPSQPATLQAHRDLLWLQIPGEAGFRPDAFGEEAHYPAVYERTLAAIDQHIAPGDLVLVGAGILGKIYCEAVRQRGGIAVDVGSILDLCGGHGGTRGEYRMHPWLHQPAAQAFRPA